MKKLLMSSAVAVGAMCASVAQAQTDLFEDWEEKSYVQAKLGFADVGTSDDALALTGVYGLNAEDIHPALSFEAELMTTLVDGESSFPSSQGTTTVEASAWGLGAYAVGRYDELPVDNLSVYGRLGLAYTSAEASAENGSVGASSEGSEFGLGITVGGKYAINEQFGVLVDFTTTEIDIVNIGVQYTF